MTQEGRETVEVPASEIVLSDLVYIPNSRHAQEITMLMDSSSMDEDGVTHRTFHVGSARWTVRSDTKIRAERLRA